MKGMPTPLCVSVAISKHLPEEVDVTLLDDDSNSSDDSSESTVTSSDSDANDHDDEGSSSDSEFEDVPLEQLRVS